MDALTESSFSPRILSSVESPGTDKTQAGLSSEAVGEMLGEILRMHGRDGRVSFAANTLPTMRAVFPNIAALVGMPFFDAKREPQFCLLIGADQTHTLLAAEEVLSCIAVAG